MSIFKNPNGNGWVASVHKRIDGKRYRREKVCATRDGAKEAELQLIAEIKLAARGSIAPPEPSLPTIDDIVALYFTRHYTKPTNSRLTMQARLRHFTDFCRKEGLLYLHQFTEPMAEAYWASLCARFKGKGPYGKWESANSLVMFAMTLDDVRVTKNVMKLVKRDALVESEEERWMDDELIDALMECAKHQHEDARLSYDILLDCGLRRDELRMLPQSRIDLKTNQIRIAKHTDRKGRTWEPKTKKSTRWVPMSAKAVMAAKRLLAKYPGSYYLLPAMNEVSGGINDPIEDPRGENWLPMRWDELRAMTVRAYPKFRPVLHETIGDTGRFAITLHSFRHTLATRLLRNGFAIPLIGKMLGHSSAFITEKYAKFAQSDLREAANFLDRKYQPQLGTDSGTARIIKMAKSA